MTVSAEYLFIYSLKGNIAIIAVHTTTGSRELAVWTAIATNGAPLTTNATSEDSAPARRMSRVDDATGAYIFLFHVV
jgi:hypothetical protein